MSCKDLGAVMHTGWQMIFLSDPVQPLVFILTLKLQIGLKIFLFCFFNKEELLVIMDFP